MGRAGDHSFSKSMMTSQYLPSPGSRGETSKYNTDVGVITVRLAESGVQRSFQEEEALHLGLEE